MNFPASCRDIIDPNWTSASRYTIDIDGRDGGLAPFAVSCDLRHFDGGWTLIWSANGTIDSTNALTQRTGDGPTLGSNAYVDRLRVQALALRSQQVLVQTPSADGGVPSQWLLSVAGAAPIVNLRNGRLLNHTPDGMGTDQTANYISPTPGVPQLNSDDDLCNDPSAVAAAPYPELYWACGNLAGVHLNREAIKWDHGSFAPDAIDVYLR